MNDDRRESIVRLLRTRDEHLPQPVHRADTTAGFVNEPRSRTCPDCLANGGPTFGCETCGGSGVVTGGRLAKLAVTDELPDDTATRDPYAKNEQVLPFGFDVTRHDATRERDRQIAMLGQQTRPAPREAELLEEANRRGYVWEEERREMYRLFDYAALDVVLDRLRAVDDSAYHALHAIYVYAWMTELSPVAEVSIERGLEFLDAHLPDPIRAPGVPQHPAAERQKRRAAA